MALDKFLIYLGIIILFLALLDSYVRSEPYLVYNPTIKVVGYQLEVDGEVVDVPATQHPAGMFQLVYDLASLDGGAHVVRARAQFELWGWVPWSESFSFIKPYPMEGAQITTNPTLPSP